MEEQIQQTMDKIADALDSLWEDFDRGEPGAIQQTQQLQEEFNYFYQQREQLGTDA